MRIEKGRLRLPAYTEHLAALEGWVVIGIEIVDNHQLLALASGLRVPWLETPDGGDASTVGSDQELLVSDLVMGSGLAQAAVKAGQLQV